MTDYSTELSWARARDAADPLRAFRDEFELLPGAGGQPLVYLCGNSLGLMPKGVRAQVNQELDDWARYGVEGHHLAKTPWYSYHEQFRESGARLVGAVPGEVVMMNTLTTNLHLMMVSFYRPSGRRVKVLMEEAAFPSDTYAVATHLESRGVDPRTAVIIAKPRPGELTLRTEDVERLIGEHGEELALVLLPGVQYYTGQWLDLGRLTAAAHRAGALIGWDLAHAVGNVPLSLHEWDVDFAVWCSYKYLNGGPGAPGGCFVHERHGRNTSLGRLAGWWGNDPATRFRMHLNAEFVPREGADGWQLSNPPILAMAPLITSIALFERAGMRALRSKSEALTGYLEFLLRRLPAGRVEIITPEDPAARGCQLSLLVRDRGREVFDRLRERGILPDFRQPDVIRAAPAPFYNTFEDVWRVGQVVHEVLG
jgi:kynureninase